MSIKIALFGASGMIGQRILAEARARGHQVTTVSRNASGDIFDPESVRRAAAGQDAVISA
jgi:putative NADH-flavin reductase